jgi:MYXO-CTERM domain-containing protein
MPANISLQTWHHYALTRSADPREVRFYVDGVLLGDPVPFDRLPTGGGRGMLYLGSDTAAYLGDSDFHGRLDEVCIFNTILDDVAVGSLFNGYTDCTTVVDPENTDTDTDTDTDTTDTDTDTTDTDTDTDTDPNIDDGERPDGSCGCRTSPAQTGWALLCLSLLAVRRRRL